MKAKNKFKTRKLKRSLKVSSNISTILIAIILIATFSFLNAESIEAKANNRAINDYTDNREILWLARIIYSETKKADEQVLVAWVARNRVETNYRSNSTYYETANDRGQFSGLHPSDAQYLHNISRNYDSGGASWQRALEIAKAVYYSPGFLRPFPQTVRHFYSPKSLKIAPEWSAGHKPVVTIKENTEIGVSVRFAFYDGVK